METSFFSNPIEVLSSNDQETNPLKLEICCDGIVKEDRAGMQPY